MEEQILPYYLRIFSLLFLISIFYLLFIIFIKNIVKSDEIINIKKNSNIYQITNEIFSENNNFEKIIYYSFLKIVNLNRIIHYGKFKFDKNSNFFDVVKIITNVSNFNEKITLIGGWQKFEVIKYLKKFFKTIDYFKYEDFLADTYLIKNSSSYKSFIEYNAKEIDKLFLKYKNSNLLKKFSRKQIMIIASLVEKEAYDYQDKRIISAIIINRLDKKMKLQIDATTIFSITNGEYKLQRKLRLSDLKINHPYNTYQISAIPPGLICIVEKKTIELVLENYKHDYLFYFYDSLKNKHIYSKNYNDHKKKLNEYRKKTK